MVFQRSFLRSLPVAFILCGLLLVLPGCPLSPDEDDNPPDSRLDDPTTPELTLSRLSQVWEREQYLDLERLLHDGFQFFPLDEDAVDFPWLPESGSWGRTKELEFAANMFDENFSGEQPPVDSITWDFNILSRRETTDATYGAVTELTTTALITVLTGPDQGFSSDTKFIFLVIQGTYPEHADWYQILEQREVPRQS